jgi:hypothetical protein
MAAKLGSNPIQKRFLLVFLITLFFKLFIAATIPITGDEALFIVWARDLAWGYYDHPPMIGWALALVMEVSSSLSAVRMPAVLSNHLIALGLIYLIQRFGGDSERAYLIGMAYVLLPISVLNVLVTNDTTLLVFLFASLFCFLLSLLGDSKSANSSLHRYGLASLAGVFVGMAFLSKYLAVIVLIPYVVISVKEGRWRELVALLASAFPFALINFLWNMNSCWQNFQFNFVNRLDDKVMPWVGLPMYAATLLYLFTPWLVYFLWKNRKIIAGYFPIATMAFIPICLFALLSLRQLIGLHWIPILIPAVMLLLGLTASQPQLTKSIRWNAYFTAPHAILILVLILAPMSTWQGLKIYDKFSLLKYSDAVSHAAVSDMPQGATLMTKGYSTSAIFAYYLDQEVPVFGVGSKFGRHDDLNTDFQVLDGKAIRIFDNSPINLNNFNPYFADVKLGSFTYRGVQYWVVDGSGFQYERYRTGVLQKIADRFYQIPDFLPAGQCHFLKHYDLP